MEIVENNMPYNRYKFIKFNDENTFNKFKKFIEKRTNDYKLREFDGYRFYCLDYQLKDRPFNSFLSYNFIIDNNDSTLILYHEFLDYDKNRYNIDLKEKLEVIEKNIYAIHDKLSVLAEIIDRK